MATNNTKFLDWNCGIAKEKNKFSIKSMQIPTGTWLPAATRLSRHETKDFKRRRGILNHHEVIPRLLSPGHLTFLLNQTEKQAVRKPNQPTWRNSSIRFPWQLSIKDKKKTMKLWLWLRIDYPEMFFVYFFGDYLTVCDQLSYFLYFLAAIFCRNLRILNYQFLQEA